MFLGNVKIAMAAIRGAKWRSFLTMLGIIIGVASVITTVSLGEGIKRQVLGQIETLGSDLITIRPGKAVTRDEQGNVTGLNIFSTLSGSLTEQDVRTIQTSPHVRVAVPFSFIPGIAETSERKFDTGTVIATTENLPEVLNQKVGFGTFFSGGDTNKHVAVIGKRVAEQLFQENVPVGKSLRIRGESFVVRGVFDEFSSNPLTPGLDYNSAIYIPENVGKAMNNNNLQVFQVLAKPTNPGRTDDAVKAIETGLLKEHAGQHDFTILKQEEALEVTSTVVNLLTQLIAGIAAISLIVGGIGIMNIMLVSVTERTHEIGIRKAIGATNRQIMGQFLIEAVMLSLIGGFFGVLLSILINFLLRIFTNLQPVVALPAVGVAAGVSLVVGVVFGIAPAFKAAHKDPIEALRQV